MSTVNLALCFPLVSYGLDKAESKSWLFVLIWLLVLIVIPAILGTLFGISAHKGWPQSLLHKLGMAPLHAVPTAWDWKFGLRQECWVHVTLTDGMKFAGYCGTNSFMSSDPGERDVYIEAVCKIDDNDIWSPTGSGLYIAHAKISTIEFWPVKESEANDDAQSKSRSPQHSGQGLPTPPVNAGLQLA